MAVAAMVVAIAAETTVAIMTVTVIMMAMAIIMIMAITTITLFSVSAAFMILGCGAATTVPECGEAIMAPVFGDLTAIAAMDMPILSSGRIIPIRPLLQFPHSHLFTFKSKNPNAFNQKPIIGTIAKIRKDIIPISGNVRAAGYKSPPNPTLNK